MRAAARRARPRRHSPRCASSPSPRMEERRDSAQRRGSLISGVADLVTHSESSASRRSSKSVCNNDGRALRRWGSSVACNSLTDAFTSPHEPRPARDAREPSSSQSHRSSVASHAPQEAAGASDPALQGTVASMLLTSRSEGGHDGTKEPRPISDDGHGLPTPRRLVASCDSLPAPPSVLWFHAAACPSSNHQSGWKLAGVRWFGQVLHAKRRPRCGAHGRVLAAPKASMTQPKGSPLRASSPPLAGFLLLLLLPSAACWDLFKASAKSQPAGAPARDPAASGSEEGQRRKLFVPENFDYPSPPAPSNGPTNVNTDSDLCYEDNNPDNAELKNRLCGTYPAFPRGCDDQSSSGGTVRPIFLADGTVAEDTQLCTGSCNTGCDCTLSRARARTPPAAVVCLQHLCAHLACCLLLLHPALTLACASASACGTLLHVALLVCRPAVRRPVRHELRPVRDVRWKFR